MSDHIKTANLGKELVASKLRDMGLDIEFMNSKKNIILAYNYKLKRKVQLRIKTRRTKSWQASIDDGKEYSKPLDEVKFWIFVDL